MDTLNDKIITRIENAINASLNGCTPFKTVFDIPEAVTVNNGVYNGYYTLIKNDKPVLLIFYRITYCEISLNFFKFTDEITGIFANAPKSFSLCTTETVLTEYIDKVVKAALGAN